MHKVRIEQDFKSKIEEEAANFALHTLEVVEKAEYLGVIMQDKKGIFVKLRQGSEVEILRSFYDIDWRRIFSEMMAKFS